MHEDNSQLDVGQHFWYNILTAFIWYRNYSIEKLTGIAAVIYSGKINPNNLTTLRNYSHRITRSLSLSYLIERRFYEKTLAHYSGYNNYGIRLSSNLYISSNFSLPITAKYSIGNSAVSSSITGLELGLGLNFTF